MALTANRDLKFFASQELIDLGVDDDVQIYKGALVGRNRSTGYARGLVAGDEFLGVAYKAADNTISGHTAGGITVRLHQAVDIVHALTSVAVADIGKDVYASADDTLTLAPADNSRVGRIVAVDATNVARVRCQPVSMLDGVLDNRPVIVLADASVTLTLDHMNRVLLIGNAEGVTLTLPPIASVRAGGWIRVIKTSADLVAVNLDGNASETIDGSTSFGDLDAQYDTVHLVATASEWIIADRDIA